VDPLDTLRRNDDQVVLEFFSGVGLEERENKLQDIPCRGWIHFKPDYSGMPFEGQNHPVAEVLVKSHKYPFIIYGLTKNLSVIRP